MGDAEPEMDESAIPKLAPVCLGVVQKLYPDDDQHPTIEALAPIWDEVVQRIIVEMTALDLADEVALHINIREEMVMELVRLQFWLAERVVEKRIGGRTLSEIDAEREREECLGPEGSSTFSATAQMAYEHVWSKRMKERWQPKSAKALQKETNPKQAKLAVKAVAKNPLHPALVHPGQLGSRQPNSALAAKRRRLDSQLGGHRRVGLSPQTLQRSAISAFSKAMLSGRSRCCSKPTP